MSLKEFLIFHGRLIISLAVDVDDERREQLVTFYNLLVDFKRHA